MTDIVIEIESELEDLEIKRCSELFNFRKLLSREEKLSAIILKIQDIIDDKYLKIILKIKN